MTDETPPDKAGKPSEPVDVVIDALDRRTVSSPDRGRLHKALDRADAPLGGRSGADQGVGRAIEKAPSRHALRPGEFR